MYVSAPICSGCHSRTPQPPGLKQRGFPALSRGGWGSKIRMPAGLVSGRPLALPCRRPPAGCVLMRPSRCKCISSPVQRGPPKQPRYNATTSLKSQSPNAATFCAGTSAPTYNFGGTVQPMAAPVQLHILQPGPDYLTFV